MKTKAARYLIPVVVAVFALFLAPAFGAESNQHADYRDMEISECNECHLGEGVQPNHQAGWNVDHRLKAVKGESNCAVCHDQSFCLDCHTGGGIGADLDVSNYKADYVPKSHRSDFREIHPIQAASDPNSCERCHDPQFCSDCHEKTPKGELQFQSHREGWSSIEASPGVPHSSFSTSQCQTCHPGGVLPVKRWSVQHARDARRNLKSCESCHPEGNVCLTCHSARTGLQVSPHPSGWGGIKDNINGVTNGKTCRKCH
ncbi:MAG: cytochrome C [Deltaproteobacteria bacterium]|nr:MAG: cytochrome C [Deltaproteobacteria bacterium]